MTLLVGAFLVGIFGILSFVFKDREKIYYLEMLVSLICLVAFLTFQSPSVAVSIFILTVTFFLATEKISKKGKMRTFVGKKKNRTYKMFNSLSGLFIFILVPLMFLNKKQPLVELGLKKEELYNVLTVLFLAIIFLRKGKFWKQSH